MKKLTIVLGMILAISVVSGFPCYCQGNSIIYGCYNKKQGQLRIVSDPNSCRSSEIPISWNIIGSEIPTISGSWTGVLIAGEVPILIQGTTAADRPCPFTATITQTESSIVGDFYSCHGLDSFTGTIDSLCRLSFTIVSKGVFNGKVSGDTIYGTFTGANNGLMIAIGPQTGCP